MMNVLHWIDLIIMFTWPLICAAHLVLRTCDPFKRRMQRGAVYRWWIQNFGLLGQPVLIVTFVYCFAIPYVLFTHRMWPLDIFWTYILVAVVIDYVTGSDDPPWRKLSRAGAKLLEKIKPVPQPAIGFGRR